MINIAQETLDFRRQSFSLCLSLLMPTSSFPNAPAWVTPHLRRSLECSPTALSSAKLRYRA